jgi:haloalkane dehalogenase
MDRALPRGGSAANNGPALSPLDRFDALPRRDVHVLGFRMSTIDVGRGDPPVVLLHGNPTWSYQWREIIPLIARERRTLAPDLIGFGRSDHPRATYDWDLHARTVSAFLDTLPRHVLVAHDWGAAFAGRYAIDHPDRVIELILMEPSLMTETWDDYQGARRERFRALRDPSRNVDLIERQNQMVEAIRDGVMRQLAEEEMDGYRAPYLTPQDRHPIRRFVEMKPIGDDSETWAAYRDIEDGLRSLRIPVRVLTVDPGALLPPERVKVLRSLIPHLQVEHLGPGQHHFQEDYPREIAAAILRGPAAGSS